MKRPIFILGQMQRTGTNFLSDLLVAHPDVVSMAPVMEDNLLRHSDILRSYTDRVAHSWTQSWGVPDSERESLLVCLGQGISSYVAKRDLSNHVVTKMPSVDSLAMAEHLLNSATVLVLVRDGSDVCESIHKSFGWSYERAMRRWASAADQILEFDHLFADHPNYQLVRYETLVSSPHETVSEILETCGLDVASYDFAAIADMPVRGSSTLKASGQSVHWDQVEKTEEFSPMSRSAGWDAKLRGRFSYLAGEQARLLGYTCDDSAVTSVGSDLRYGSERAYNWLRRRVRVIGGHVLRKLRIVRSSATEITHK